MRSVRTVVARWGAVWLALSLLAMACRVAVWSVPSLDGGLTERGWSRGVMHIVTTLMAPGERVIAMADRTPGEPDWITVVIASVVSATVWVAALGAIAILRRFSINGRRRGGGEVDRGRRRFLFDTTAAGCALVGASGLGAAAIIQPQRLTTRRYELPIADLPEALDGLRIVQVSDTHLGPRVSAELVRRAVDGAVDLRPDVFALTGDYISFNPDYIDPLCELLRPIVDAAGQDRPPLAVLGNHDWWADGPRCAKSLTGIGVRMIDNDRVYLDAATRRIVDEPTASCLRFAGLGDLWEDKVGVYEAFHGESKAIPCVTLAHQPDTAELVELTGAGPRGPGPAPRIDVMLSGHTHGGQVKLPIVGAPFVPSLYGQKYLGGVVRAPAFPVVVSRGVGMSLLPIRIGTRPELVELTLRRSASTRDMVGM